MNIMLCIVLYGLFASGAAYWVGPNPDDFGYVIILAAVTVNICLPSGDPPTALPTRTDLAISSPLSLKHRSYLN